LESTPELAELESKISSVEQSIKKEEKGRYEEFYDLNLIQKGATARSIYTDGEWIVLLDAKGGKVYVLDNVEKSVDTYSAKQIKSASFVAVHQDVPYVFGPTIGVVKLADPQKGEQVIPADKDWGSIKDFWMYSGNVYLLDAGTGAIYKYLVAEEGYSSKRPYFDSGQTGVLTKASAMAIDSSIYVSAGQSVLKYTTGARDTYSVSIPDEGDVTFEDIYTSADVDNVYVLDTDSQRIFIFSKEGAFEKQISASILKGADDFIVDPEHGILVLAQDTIYRIKE
jgi:hypothetical protein